MSREKRSWEEQLFLAARELAPAKDKGRIYAAHFGNFLRGLMGQGVISDWRETEKNSPDDCRGVDFWIAVEGERFGFQITSTKRNAQRRMSKHPVYALWLRLEDEFKLKSDKRLKRELLEGIDWYRDEARGRVMFGYRGR